ncbi:MAG TPA: hypothetical protein VMH85_07725, partial [Terriglobales bacterium]|nr:hypothetical protein [Terriglobales bacterium]
MHPRAAALWGRIKAHRWASTLTIMVTLATGILIGTVISSGVKGQDKKSSDPAQLTLPSPQQLSNQFSQIAKQLEPSVVNINTESTPKVTRRRGAPSQDGEGSPFDDFFNHFFGGQGGQGATAIPERSLGSGVIVDAKGYIVTNRHVV